ncbi:nucleoside hydrolase [Pseudovibrio sp. Alg231-02]|uniref:nucleoside hydrolase n=1 Tax=Pseudovibrio sp. Alg231-02 TaxID=1922223 RepID=UPI000D54B2F9|nr:nucleoside hydrolase [Pseudovibrio sp. Alg231-02]
MNKLWIDTDTASDDAVALMIAMSLAPERITGISTVAGNVPVNLSSRNASYIARLCEFDTAIHEGAASPLCRPLKTAQYIHGEDGMGDIGLEISTPNLSCVPAAVALAKAAQEHKGELEVVTLGPLTNIALALKLDPDFAGNIAKMTIMGGTGDCYGNVTPVSEYNIWADPEAADVVFRSSIPKVMVGWDISRKYASISDQEAEELLALGSVKAEIAVNSQKVLRAFCASTSGVVGFDLPDPITLAAAINPYVVTATKPYAVSVICQDGPARGFTILNDRHCQDTPKTTRVAQAANRTVFWQMLMEALK